MFSINLLLGFILFSLAILCKPAITQAQTFFGAGPEALGDAGRATNNAIEAHYLNPAALAFAKDFSMGGTFQETNISLPSPTNNWAFVLADCDPDKIASASFGYLNKRMATPSTTTLDQDFSVSVGFKLLQNVSIGLQGRELFRQATNTNGFTKYNLAFGTLIIPATFIGLSFTAYDMLNDDDNNMIPVMALGSHFIIMDILRLRADIAQPQKQNPNNMGSLGVGLETVSGDGFLLRTGGLWDTLNQATYWSVGLGWEGPRLSAAYAYKTNVNVAGAYTHTFQLWLTL